MPTKRKIPSLNDIITENVAQEVANEFYNALMKGNCRILSFWSLDNDTLNIDPLDRYHVGHLVYMLFVANLLTTNNCVVEANICDSYSLRSDIIGARARFFNPHKSWREGRTRMRSFLDRAYLEAEDSFVIFNLRDEFQKGNDYFHKLLEMARNEWGNTDRLINQYGRKYVSNRDYRYPNRIDENDTNIVEFHQLLKDNLWEKITVNESITLLFLLAHNPSW